MPLVAARWIVWRRLHASYLTLHWAGTPEIARRLVMAAAPPVVPAQPAGDPGDHRVAMRRDQAAVLVAAQIGRELARVGIGGGRVVGAPDHQGRHSHVGRIIDRSPREDLEDVDQHPVGGAQRRRVDDLHVRVGQRFPQLLLPEALLGHEEDLGEQAHVALPPPQLDRLGGQRGQQSVQPRDLRLEVAADYHLEA